MKLDSWGGGGGGRYGRRGAPPPEMVGEESAVSSRRSRSTGINRNRSRRSKSSIIRAEEARLVTGARNGIGIVAGAEE
jgi:hypothetical protein